MCTWDALTTKHVGHHTKGRMLEPSLKLTKISAAYVRNQQAAHLAGSYIPQTDPPLLDPHLWSAVSYNI